MAGGQERVLRRRIRSVQSTQKITRAMELIAASQIVRAQNRIAGAGPYQRGIAKVLAEAAKEAGHQAGRITGVPEDPRRVLVLSIVGDRGLCGAYNANVLRATERLAKSHQAKGVDVQVVTVGKKAPAYLRFRGLEATMSYLGMAERPAFADARGVAGPVGAAFLDESLDQVVLISTRFLSAGTQVVETRQLLPLPEPSADDIADVTTDNERVGGYTEFEPDAVDLLVELVPRYLESVIFGAMLEAAASFFTAQQRAMAAATDNADELAKTLTRIMNRARQDSITTEIMEIVGGAEALRQSASSDDA